MDHTYEQLKQHIVVRRERIAKAMFGGMPHDEYMRNVGKVDELRELEDKLKDILKRRGDDDGLSGGRVAGRGFRVLA